MTDTPITDEEMDAIYADARERMVRGRAHYGGSFMQANLRADLREELLDVMNYAALMIARLERILEPEDAPTSSELIGEH